MSDPAQFSSSPPPLPPPAVPPQLPLPLPQPPQGSAVGTPSNWRNWSQAELLAEVQRGGRFVIYPYCISALILSFRRASDVEFVPAGSDRVGSVIGYSLISLLLGWWGFPWGPIFSIGALWTNAAGGKDVTAEVLTSVDPANAAAIMAARKRPRAGVGLWLWRFFLVGIPVLIVGLILGAAALAERAEKAALQAPGGPEFASANGKLGNTKSPVVSGNTPEAAAIASAVSKSVATMRVVYFTASKGDAAQGQFPTWCELHGDHAVVLMHVPDLRRFNREAKDKLCEACWDASLRALAGDGKRPRPFTVAVGVRGVAEYDQVLWGSIAPGAATDSVVPQSIRGHSDIRARLVGWFAGK